jgi:homoserine kinase type II
MAVYTHMTRQQLEEFWQNYALPPLADFQGIMAGVSNTNYIVTDVNGTKRILTLFEDRTPAADLPYFISLMQHIASRGMECPHPILGRDANKPAAMVSFLAGASPVQPTLDHCAAMGTKLARLHIAGLDFLPQRDNPMNCAAWLDLLQRSHNGTALWANIWPIAQEICANWPQNLSNQALPRGTIHADLFPDNVFFAPESSTRKPTISGVIDWYFACTDFLAYDLAITLNAWCALPCTTDNTTNGALDNARTMALLQAYQAIRPLTAAEISALPLLLQGAALRIVSTRHYDWGHQPANAMLRAKDPAEYAQILYRHRQHPLTVAGIG